MCSWSSTFICLRELFFCIHRLAVWYKRPAFWSKSAFDLSQLLMCFPHYAESFLAFYLKWGRGLHVEHLGAIIGLLTGLVSILLFSGNREACVEGEVGNSWLLEQSEHIQHLSVKLAILYRYGSWYPQTIITVLSKITDHCNTYNNTLKVWNILRVTKMLKNVTWQHKVSKSCWKIDLFDSGF